MASFQELARKFVKSQKGNRMVRGHVFSEFYQKCANQGKVGKNGLDDQAVQARKEVKSVKLSRPDSVVQELNSACIQQSKMNRKIDEYLLGSVRGSTRGVYRRYWTRFIAFCKKNNLELNAKSVSYFLIELAESSEGKHSGLIAKCAIKFYFKLAYPKKISPTDSWLASKVIKSIKKKYSKPVKKAKCVDSSIIKALVTHLIFNKCCSLVDMRLACFILLEFTAFGRYVDISNLTISNIRFLPSGDMEVLVETSKNYESWDARKTIISGNKDGAFNPVSIIHSYIVRLLKISTAERFLFPTFLSKKSGLLVQKKPVSYDVMNRSFKATLSKLGYDGTLYSLHSPKNGALSEAANSGLCSKDQLKRHGRWSSDNMPNYYHKQSLKNKLAVSRSLKLYS